jgi:hypothetical protein
MAAVCLKTDGELSAHDVETLHALSSLLHLPPPERLGVQNYSKIRIRYGFF